MWNQKFNIPPITWVIKVWVKSIIGLPLKSEVIPMFLEVGYFKSEVVPQILEAVSMNVWSQELTVNPINNQSQIVVIQGPVQGKAKTKVQSKAKNQGLW